MMHWCSGAPYHWHNWTSTLIDPLYAPPGEPCIVTNTAIEQLLWEIDFEYPDGKYLLIEWDA